MPPEPAPKPDPALVEAVRGAPDRALAHAVLERGLAVGRGCLCNALWASTEIDPWEKINRTRAKAEKRGKALLAASDELAAFGKLFRIREVQAGGRGTSYRDLHLPDEWSAELVPRRRLGVPSSIRLVFPLSEEDKVLVDLSPKQLHAALREIPETPFVQRLAAAHPDALVHVRAAGEWLHHDNMVVRDAQQKLASLGIETPAPKTWVWCHIQFGPREGSTIVLHPLGTGIYVIDFGLENAGIWTEAFIQQTGQANVPADEVHFRPSGICSIVDKEGRLSVLKLPEE